MKKKPVVISILAVAIFATAAQADLLKDSNKALDKAGEGVKKAAKGAKEGVNKAGDSLDKTVKKKQKSK